jgi:outer membrane protein OmpA-like peptidoglycan-associated protein
MQVTFDTSPRAVTTSMFTVAMKSVTTGMLTVILAAAAAQGETDCSLAQRYLQLSRDTAASGANEEAVGLLNRAVEVCPSYAAYEALGELQSQSSEREDQRQAVKAFVAANDLAPSDAARAKTQFEYAKLLNRNGDPQNAYPLAKNAHFLNPDDGQITALAQRLDDEIRNPSHEQLVRGLQDALYQPLHITTAKPLPVLARADRAAAATVSGQRAEKEPLGASQPETGPSVSIPINFDTATTVVDRHTRPNIVTLAHALADPAFAGRKFLFVGHADRRGSDEYNMTLSRERAQAMYGEVIRLEPPLEGRIEVEGRGSREPIDPGTGPEALRANRRLQVVLK